MNNDTVSIEEVSLVLFMLQKEYFDKYFKYISKLNLEAETLSFLKTTQEYYKENKDVIEIPIEEFLTYFTVKHPVLRKRNGYTAFLSRLGTITINSNILEENLNRFLEKYFASEIVLKLTDVLDGTESDVLDEVEEIIAEFNNVKVQLNKNEDELFVSETLADILQEETQVKGLRWRLSCLNDDIGELRGCSLGHVFARVDAGKTSFLVSEVTNFAKQLADDEIILWCNNEERGQKVKLRIYQGLLECTRSQLKDFAEVAEDTFNARGGTRIKILDDASINVENIEQILKDFNVKLVVIDQGDKVHFTGEGNYSTVDRLKVLYGKFRELAKTFDVPVITVGQASGEAEGKKWISMTHMDNSKTGKPGELDYAVGIGLSADDVENGITTIRYINVCKNKMNDGVHGRHAVRFDPLRALYIDQPTSKATHVVDMM